MFSKSTGPRRMSRPRGHLDTRLRGIHPAFTALSLAQCAEIHELPPVGSDSTELELGDALAAFDDDIDG